MATPAAGTTTAYELTAGVKVNMDELIYMYSPMDLPMTLGIDAQGTMVVSKRPVDQKAFSWQDEEMLTPRAALAALATTGTTGLTVATGEALRFATGDTARIMKQDGTNEVVLISGVSNATVTVTRAYRSLTTATNLATGDVIIGIGTGLAEGSDPSTFRFRDRDTRTNYTQIFGPYKISMSGTEQVLSKYGVPDEWAHQVYLRNRELMIRIEQTLLYGIKDDDTSGKIRLTGGLLYFCTTNVDSTSTQLTISAIAAQQQECYNLGDVPLHLIVRPNGLDDINDTENTSRLRVVETDSRRGRQRVEVLDTEFGSTVIHRNRWCYSQNAFLVKPDAIIRRPLRPIVYEQLAKTGDADHAMIVGEEGFEIKGEQHMAVFTKLTDYTAA